MILSIDKMKPACLVVLALLFIFQIGFAQNVDALKEIEAHRKKQFKEFKDKKKSPLSPTDRKKFHGLNYFEPDLSYRVNARFVKNEKPEIFQMKTTTSRLPEYLKYGEVHFMLDSQQFVLEVYQSPEISKRPGYEDYLFIPFTDLTNGEETYEVGRYLEFTIPKSENVIVDFNLCYNPYCSYGQGYSCPIPPEPNRLSIAIRAGEKKFKH